MKLFLLTFSIFLLSTINIKLYCQSVQNFDPDIVMSKTELDDYRQSLWDSLPAAVGWVNDFEGIFSAGEEDTLESQIAHFEKATSIEIVIITMDTNMVAQNNQFKFTERFLKIWGIGKKLKRNGIVICLCSGYKQIEVVTDAGIESYMSEPEKEAIITNTFIPYYKNGNYFEGTLEGLNAVLATISRRLLKSF